MVHCSMMETVRDLGGARSGYIGVRGGQLNFRQSCAQAGVTASQTSSSLPQCASCWGVKLNVSELQERVGLPAGGVYAPGVETATLADRQRVAAPCSYGPHPDHRDVREAMTPSVVVPRV